MSKYYACKILNTGEKKIFTNWQDCKDYIKGKPNKIKSFPLKREAQDWLEERGHKLTSGIYFDSGTGGGRGVEIKVSDEMKNSLLENVFNKRELTKNGTYLIKDVTNNFGELFALQIAIKIALKLKLKKIFGDSKLVLDYWSKGFMNKKNLNEETINLIEKVKREREDFERQGGTIEYIDGSLNPADLGYHK